MQALYPNPRDTPTGLAQDIIKECLKLLEQPDKSQSLAATKSLVAMFNSTGKLYLNVVYESSADNIRRRRTIRHFPSSPTAIPSIQSPHTSFTPNTYLMVYHLSPHRRFEDL
jgi:hypothetical protein